MTLSIQCHNCRRPQVIASGYRAYNLTPDMVKNLLQQLGWLTEQQGEETIYTCPHCNETNERK